MSHGIVDTISSTSRKVLIIDEDEEFDAQQDEVAVDIDGYR